jgi:hypothetical protein
LFLLVVFSKNFFSYFFVNRTMAKFQVSTVKDVLARWNENRKTSKRYKDG